MNENKTRLFVVMGVSGCGKSTVGTALTAHFAAPFYDADTFHPPENVAKMTKGIPLDDADRASWLAALADLLKGHDAKGETAVLACSALKKTYRHILRVSDNVQFIYLQGDFDLIWGRMQQRQNHYMKADMLQSQLDTLEPPSADEALIVPIDQPIDAILAQILTN